MINICNTGDGKLTKEDLKTAFENALRNAQMLMSIQTGRAMMGGMPAQLEAIRENVCMCYKDFVQMLRFTILPAKHVGKYIEMCSPAIAEAIEKVF